MKITELKKFEYKGCQVHIRRLGQIFEYLIVYKGRIYNSNFVAKPKIWKLGRYSKKDLERITQLAIIGSVNSIDLLTLPIGKKMKKQETKDNEAKRKTKLLQGIE